MFNLIKKIKRDYFRFFFYKVSSYRNKSKKELKSKEINQNKYTYLKMIFLLSKKKEIKIFNPFLVKNAHSKFLKENSNC